MLIALGAFAAMYAQSGTEQNLYVLIGGITMLMIGVYRISKNIPSRYDEEDKKGNGQNTNL